MHYKDGTPAQLGDIVKARPDYIGHDIIGDVVSLTVSDKCNLRVRAIARNPNSEGCIQAAEVMSFTLTAGDCELLSRAEFVKPKPPEAVS